MISTKYAKLISRGQGFELEFAPLLSGDTTDADYLSLGWKKIVINPPVDVDQEKFFVIQNGYKETSKFLSATYDIIEKNQIYIISKYKLIAKLMEMNLWTQVKQMLEDNGLLDLFNAAQELNSEDNFFKQGIQLAKMELDMTDEQIQQFIEQVAV